MTYASADDDDSAAFNELFRRKMYKVRTCVPGIVTQVTTVGGARLVTVQPVIQQIDTLEEEVTFKAVSPIQNVPLVFPYSAGAGLAITTPVVAGDEGLVLFAERGLDNWLERGGLQPPPEPVQPRHHDLADAIFIPNIMNVPNALSNWSDDAVQIRNTTGSTLVSVSNDRIELTAGSTTITITDSGVEVSGNVDVQGDVSASNNVSAGGTNLSTHTHSGVQTGTGNSGPPN